MYFVRAAQAHDASAISRLHVDLWQESYPYIPKTVHAARSFDVRFAQWRRSLEPELFKKEPVGCLIDDGAMGGFWQVKENNDPDLPADIGHELHACYLLPRYRGTAAGPMCLERMARAAADRGSTSACVWVFRENPMRFTYRMLGFHVEVERDREIVGCNIPELGMVIDDVADLADRMESYVKRFSSCAAGSRSRSPSPRHRSGAHSGKSLRQVEK